MNLGKVEIWETSLDRIVTLREGAKGVLRLATDRVFFEVVANPRSAIIRLRSCRKGTRAGPSG